MRLTTSAAIWVPRPAGNFPRHFVVEVTGVNSWKDIESLIIALGGEISEGKGSRVRIFMNGIRAVFHRPHPKRVTDKGAVKSMRRFLKEAEVVS